MQFLNWEELPALRILLPFIGGIITGIYFPIAYTFLLPIILGLWLVLLLLFNWRKWRENYGRQWWFGVVLSSLLMLIGYVLTQQKREIEYPNHFSHSLNDSSFVLMQVNEPLIEKFRSYKAEVKVLEVRNSEERKSVFGKALVYFEKDSLTKPLQYGDLILVKNSLKPITPPKNPGEFDYQKYLSYQQIYHQAYIKSDQFNQLPLNIGHPLYAFVYHLRTYFINAINTYLTGFEEKSVAMALLLGYTHFLPDDIEDTYSHTGTIHVLAISGLHVGIIYLSANWLLSLFFKRGRWAIIVKSILVIGIVWFYALLSGLPPSVNRASLMFTLFAIGHLTNRRTNSYNIIATSALIILFYDPFIITRIGFQLSYLAVIGIIFYQPRIYNLFDINNWLLDKVWQASTVTLAAQLVVTPITIYYFNQFPTYFILGNLLAVPLSGYLLPFGFLFFICSPIAPVATILGAILSAVLKWLNMYLSFIQQLPFAVIQGLSVSMPEVLVMYLILGLLTIAFVFRQKRYIQWALMVMLLLSLGWAYNKYRNLHYTEIAVFQLKGATAIEFVKGYHSIVLADSAGIDQLTAASKRRPEIRKRHYLPLQEQEEQANPGVYTGTNLFPGHLLLDLPFIQFFDKRILLLSDSTDYCSVPSNSKIRIDYVLLTHNCRAELSTLQNCFDFDTLVIDGSNKGWLAKKWAADADSLSLVRYNTYEQGAFVHIFH